MGAIKIMPCLAYPARTVMPAAMMLALLTACTAPELPDDLIGQVQSPPADSQPSDGRVVYPPPPEPRPAPGLDAMPADLAERLTFVPPVGNARRCEDLLPDAADLPMLTGFRSAPGSVDGLLCLFGFPIREGTQFDLVVYGPDGGLLGEDTFRLYSVGTEDLLSVLGNRTREPDTLIPDGTSAESAGVSVIALYLWLPVGVPAGTWSAQAQAGDMHVRATFEIEPPDGMVISTLPEGSINPLLDRRCERYEPGQVVRIAGTGFASDSLVSVGLYYLAAFDPATDARDLTPVYGDVVAADAQGSFVTGYTVAEGDQPGIYYVISGPQQTSSKPLNPPCFEIVEALEPAPAP